MTEEEIHAWITFSTVPDMGLEDAVRLLGDFGSPGAVLDSSLSELRHAVPDELARRIASGPEDEQAACHADDSSGKGFIHFDQLGSCPFRR